MMLMAEKGLVDLVKVLLNRKDPLIMNEVLCNLDLY